MDFNQLRDCFSSCLPAALATADADGSPRVVHPYAATYLGDGKVALAHHPCRTTHQNLAQSLRARLLVTSTTTGQQFRLTMQYLGRFANDTAIDAVLARVLTVQGATLPDPAQMEGAELFQILTLEPVLGRRHVQPPQRRDYLPALRSMFDQLQHCHRMDHLCSTVLACLEQELDISHSMLLLLNESGTELNSVASRGYAVARQGVEVAVGAGIIGLAAQRNAIFRINVPHENMWAGGGAIALPRSTPAGSPVLHSHPGSQIALPLRVQEKVTGVLFAECRTPRHFSYQDEDALSLVADLCASQLQLLQATVPAEGRASAPLAERPPVAGQALLVRYYPHNDSIFFDDSYLIKGVAGAMLWALLTDYMHQAKAAFTYRELRLDPRLNLPGLLDNLASRLLLLAHRLAEHDAGVNIIKTGRGEFELQVRRPLQLREVSGA